MDLQTYQLMDLISRYFETHLIFSPKAYLRFVELVDVIKIKASLSLLTPPIY